MAKYCGKIGYVMTVEDPSRPGVYIEKEIEQLAFGDYMKNPGSSWQMGTNINDDLNVNNRISIMADPFAFANFQHIKYAEFMGVLWKVKSVEVERPRIILSIGGVYTKED